MKAFGTVNASEFYIYPQGSRDTSLAIHAPAGAFLLVNATEANGKTMLSLPSGDLISMQPNGDLETRPSGQVGAWELGVLKGDVIVYTPDPSTGRCWPMALREA